MSKQQKSPQKQSGSGSSSGKDCKPRKQRKFETALVLGLMFDTKIQMMTRDRRRGASKIQVHVVSSTDLWHFSLNRAKQYDFLVLSAAPADVDCAATLLKCAVDKKRVRKAVIIPHTIADGQEAHQMLQESARRLGVPLHAIRPPIKQHDHLEGWMDRAFRAAYQTS